MKWFHRWANHLRDLVAVIRPSSARLVIATSRTRSPCDSTAFLYYESNNLEGSGVKPGKWEVPETNRGVAKGWTGVHMSTPLLPEVVPELDANPVSFYSEGWGSGVGRSLQNTENEANLLLTLGTKS